MYYADLFFLVVLGSMMVRCLLIMFPETMSAFLPGYARFILLMAVHTLLYPLMMSPPIEAVVDGICEDGVNTYGGNICGEVIYGEVPAEAGIVFVLCVIISVFIVLLMDNFSLSRLLGLAQRS